MKPLILLLLIILVSACQSNDGLPVLSKKAEGSSNETYKKIPDFRFINQDSAIITNSTFAGKVYVADFFFTSCPTICPMMTQQMLRIYKQYETDDRLLLLSHSIDTKHDTVGRLREYANNLEVESTKWHFVTGEKAAIFEIADDYFNIVVEDASLPGGYDHSGRFTLVDQDGLIRAYCNGTDPAEVDQFMKSINKLLEDEY